MVDARSQVTIHMAASLDGFIARPDGSVDWMATKDEYPAGDTLDPEFVAAFLKSIDCYVMGARTYETALRFEAQGHGWAYGDTPVVVLTHGDPPRSRDTVELWSGDLAELMSERLRPLYRHIWIAGGAAVASEALRRGLADEIVYSILPVLIGEGIKFFQGIDRDVALQLVEVKAYRSGMVEMRYDVRG